MVNSRLSRNALIYLFGGVIAVGGNFLLTPIYINILNVSDYGNWSKFLLLFQIMLAIFGLGLMATMTRLLVNKKSSRIDVYLSTSTWISSIYSLIVVTLLVFANIFLRYFYNVESLFNINLDYYVYASICAASLVYMQILMGKYLLNEEAIKYRGISLISFSMQLIFLFSYLYIVNEATLLGVILTMLTSMVAAGFFAFAILIARHGKVFEKEAAKKILSFSVPVAFYIIAGQANDFGTRFMLVSFVDDVEIGVFTATFMYTSVIAMAASAINLAWVPIFYKNYKAFMIGDIYKNSTKVFSALIAALTLVLVFFSEWFFFTYTSGKIEVDRILITTLAMYFWMSSSIWMSVSNPLFFKKKTKIIFHLTLLAFLQTIVITYFLIREYGSNGAGIGLIINSIFMILYGYYYLKKYDLDRIDYKYIIKIFLLLVLIFNMYIQESIDTGPIVAIVFISLFYIFISVRKDMVRLFDSVKVSV